MDRAAPRDALERYYAALNRRDPAGLVDLVDADIVFDDDFYGRQVIRGVEAFTATLAGLWQAFPDLTFTILDGPFCAEHDPRCAVHVRLTGTLAVAVPDWGFTNVGGLADVEFMGVYQFRGDRVAHIRVCTDPTVAARQLGSPLCE